MDSIEEVLTQGWPKEVDVLGAATVSRIAKGVEGGAAESELFRSESGGGELTFHQIVIDMIAVASVAKAAIEITLVIGRAGKKPTAHEVATALAKKKLSATKAVIQRVISVLQSLNKIA